MVGQWPPHSGATATGQALQAGRRALTEQHATCTVAPWASAAAMCQRRRVTCRRPAKDRPSGSQYWTHSTTTAAAAAAAPARARPARPPAIACCHQPRIAAPVIPSHIRARPCNYSHLDEAGWHGEVVRGESLKTGRTGACPGLGGGSKQPLNRLARRRPTLTRPGPQGGDMAWHGGGWRLAAGLVRRRPIPALLGYPSTSSGLPRFPPP